MALPSAQKVKTELHTFLLEGNKDITRSSWKQVYSACLGRVVGSQTSYHRNICGGKQVTPSFFDGKVFFDDSLKQRNDHDRSVAEESRVSGAHALQTVQIRRHDEKIDPAHHSSRGDRLYTRGL